MDAIDIGNVRPLIPLQIDPPDHVKFRRLLDPLFAPREVAKLEAEVRSLVNDLIDDVRRHRCVRVQRRRRGPAAVHGVPPPHGPAARGPRSLPALQGRHHPARGDRRDEQRAAMARATGAEIYAYFERVVAERRAEPQDDLLSGFIAAEIDGERLSTEDILDISYLFLLAGLDTVTASLGCAVAYLAAHPDRQQALRDDPSLVPAAVEELLRWETPVPGVPRITTQDVEIARHDDRRRVRPSPACSRRAEHRRRGVPRAGVDRLRPRRATATSRSAAACTAASARTSPGSRCGSRSRSSTGACPPTRSPRARRRSTRWASASLEYLPLVVDRRLMRVAVDATSAPATVAATRSRPRCSVPTTSATARSSCPTARSRRPRGAGAHRPRQLPRARDHDLRVARVRACTGTAARNVPARRVGEPRDGGRTGSIPSHDRRHHGPSGPGDRGPTRGGGDLRWIHCDRTGGPMSLIRPVHPVRAT